MKYQVEDVSPTHKKVEITISQEEVNASISATVLLYKPKLTLKGYRKGKVPNNVIEKHFAKEILQQAKSDILNVEIQQIFDELKITPFAPFSVNADGDLDRNQEFKYSLDFDVLPDFELPNYEGLEINEREMYPVTQEEIDDLIARYVAHNSKYVKIKDDELAQDNDVVSLDFVAFDHGKPIQEFQTTNFRLHIGAKQTLPEFEELVKTIKQGKSGEKDILLPKDFINQTYADKILKFKVKVNSIQRLQLAEFNDELAKKQGFTDTEELKAKLIEIRDNDVRRIIKNTSHHLLLDQITSKVDNVPLPENMLKLYTESFASEFRYNIEIKGQRVDRLTEAQIRRGAATEAAINVKQHVILMKIAQKEGLSVKDKDVQQEIYQIATRNGFDYEKLRLNYEQTGQYFIIANNILASSVLEMVYARAKVTVLPFEKFQEEQNKARLQANLGAAVAEAAQAAVQQSQNETVVEQAPAEQAPAEQAPAEQAPAEQAPAEQAPVEQTPNTESAAPTDENQQG